MVSAIIMNPACHLSRRVSQAIRFLGFFILRHHNPRMATAKPTSRFKSDIRIKPTGKKAAPETTARPCAKAGCKGEGVHRVSRTRENLGEYIWLCLGHAREHNESWDYFRGMDDKDIETFRTDALTGHR